MSQSKATPKGFEPLRAEPNGFLVHLLSHSDKVSVARSLALSRFLPEKCQLPLDYRHSRSLRPRPQTTSRNTNHSYRNKTWVQCRSAFPRNYTREELEEIKLPTTRGPVAQWIRHRPTEPGIVGSSPTRIICVHLCSLMPPLQKRLQGGRRSLCVEF